MQGLPYNGSNRFMERLKPLQDAAQLTAWQDLIVARIIGSIQPSLDRQNQLLAEQNKLIRLLVESQLTTAEQTAAYLEKLKG
jgi:hypothetical protein